MGLGRIKSVVLLEVVIYFHLVVFVQAQISTSHMEERAGEKGKKKKKRSYYKYLNHKKKSFSKSDNNVL